MLETRKTAGLRCIFVACTAKSFNNEVPFLTEAWQTWYSTTIGDSVTRRFAACRQAEHRFLPVAAAQGILAPA